jgi:hypothetical protein
MSSANNQVFGDDVTVTYTSAIYPLGTERLVLGSQTNGLGDQVWRFVKNDEAANAFAVGNPVIQLANTASTGTAVISTGASIPRLRVLGVAQHAIAAQSFGWVLARGRGTILATAAGVAQDTAFASDAAAGTVVAAPNSGAGATAVIGVTDVAIGAGVTGTAWINCR